jgi:hypothetical protein
MIDMDNRLRAARGIAKTETEASVEVFETLKRRGYPDAPPRTISDGWGEIDDAMVEVYGVVPEYICVEHIPLGKTSYTTSRVRSRHCAWRSSMPPSVAGNHARPPWPLDWRIKFGLLKSF